MVTLTTIAEKSGVSIATVSNVLNNKGSFAESTRDKIIQVALEAGYLPNAAARAFKTGRFNTVSLISTDNPVASVISQETILAIEEYLREKDYKLLFERISEKTKYLKKIIVPISFTERCIDGVLLNYTLSEKRFLSKIKEYKIPYVQINVDGTYDCVHPDDFSAAYYLTNHLIRLGHKKIHYLNFWSNSGAGSNCVHYSFNARFEGYVSAMLNAGLKPVKMFADEKIYDSKRTEFCRKWLESSERPTAIITYHPEYCLLPVIFAALSLGINIPDDLSVCSFDNKVQKFLDLDLTIMKLPDAKIGYAAADMLLEKINNPKTESISKVIPLTFYQGQTIKKPK